MNLRIIITIGCISLLSLLILYVWPSSISTAPNSSVPCQEPLTYRLGNIDERFNISNDELLSLMEEVADVWYSALDRPPVTYDPAGQVEIHLVYSDEQLRTEEEKELSGKIEAKRKQITPLKKEYDRLLKGLKKEEKKVQQNISKYDDLRELLHSDSSKDKPRITSDLNRLKNIIEQQQTKLKDLQRRVNSKVDRLNFLSDQEDELITTYNDKFAKAVKFDQGRYIKKGDSEKINIYQFSNKAELRAVLAHELGHALGLDHVSNPTSVMHKMMEKQDMFNLKLSKADRNLLMALCNSTK